MVICEDLSVKIFSTETEAIDFTENYSNSFRQRIGVSKVIIDDEYYKEESKNKILTSASKLNKDTTVIYTNTDDDDFELIQSVSKTKTV